MLLLLLTCSFWSGPTAPPAVQKRPLKRAALGLGLMITSVCLVPELQKVRYYEHFLQTGYAEARTIRVPTETWVVTAEGKRKISLLWW